MSQIRIPNNGCFENTAAHNFQRRLLKKELAKAKNTLKKHKNSYNVKRSTLIGVINEKSCHRLLSTRAYAPLSRQNPKFSAMGNPHFHPVLDSRDFPNEVINNIFCKAVSNKECSKQKTPRHLVMTKRA